MIEKIESLCKSKTSDATIGSYRVISDHVRAVSFMLSDGILFDKVGRGYVMRRIARRAISNGYLIGFRKPFMGKVVDTLCEIMGDHYGFLNEKKAYIKEQILLEEERFFKTIDKGMNLFNEELVNTKNKFNGEIAFKLYDTFGFPLDLTEDMLRKKDLVVDINSYEKCMEVQKTKARAAWKGSGDNAKDGDFKEILGTIGKNKFVGYEHTSSHSKIIALLDENYARVTSLSKGSIGWVMLDCTPFYATSGGQVGDIGALEGGINIATVEDTQKFFDLNLSKVEVVSGELSVGDDTEAVVVSREEVEKHHSATHLLQSALKIVLGDTVSQAGSLNESNRLRFDFTYPKAMTQEQIIEVEDLVNSMIAHNIVGDIKELPIEEAKQVGAIAMFGEKYGKIVRVVKFGEMSVEFCGGTHVENTAQIGSFYITAEKGVSAGVRRIEAVCGLEAIKYTKSFINKISALESEVKNKDVLLGVVKLKEQIKSLKKELEEVQSNTSQPLKEEMINDTKVVVDIVKNGDLKKIVDDIKNANDKVAIFLFQAKGNKVMMVAGSKNITIKAGNWIKAIAPIVGGGGGGRPDFAQAGGKDASKIEEAKEKALEFVKDNL